MNETWKTVAISLGTSLIVSFTTFIFGMRSGKNDADREKLQALYKSLYAHFDDLKKSIQEDRCKTWDCYDHVKHGDITRYIPPVKKLEISGDIIYLKKRIAEKAIDLEAEIMNFGGHQKDAVSEIHSVFLENLNLFRQGYKFEEYSHNKGQKNCFKSANPDDCRMFYRRRYSDLYSEIRFKSIMDSWEKRSDCAIEFYAQGNPPAFSLTLYPSCLAVPLGDFTSEIINCCKDRVSGYAEYEKQKQLLLNDIEKLMKKLRKRAKEPHGFWETIFGAMADLFR